VKLWCRNFNGVGHFKPIYPPIMGHKILSETREFPLSPGHRLRGSQNIPLKLWLLIKRDAFSSAFILPLREDLLIRTLHQSLKKLRYHL
jgi:hypothetical protein